jgi:hypothetical protein
VLDLHTARWRKSRRSSATADCVEVTLCGPCLVAGFRDSKNPTGPVLAVPADSLSALLVTVAG